MPRVPLPSLRFGDVPGDLGKTLERVFRPLNDFLVPAQAALNKALVLGDTVQIEGPREVAVPTSYSLALARYRLDAVQSLAASGVVTRLNYDLKLIDTHNAVTTGASWVFTAPTAGEYLVTALMNYAAVAPGDSILIANRAGGASEAIRIARFNAGINFMAGSGSHVFSLNAGDTVFFTGQQFAAATQALETGSALVSIQQISTRGSPTVASCWPLYIASKLPGPPKSVLLAQAQEKNGTSNYGPCSVDWEYVTPGGIPHVKIRNVPGLPAGKTWNLTFRIEWGG